MSWWHEGPWARRGGLRLLGGLGAKQGTGAPGFRRGLWWQRCDEDRCTNDQLLTKLHLLLSHTMLTSIPCCQAATG